MGWFRALNLTNKLLLVGVVAFIGFMAFASSDFSAFSAEKGYVPVKEVDKVSFKLDLTSARIGSDGQSGNRDAEIIGGTPFRTFGVTGDLSVSTIGYAMGRRSYASAERICIGNPLYYSTGTPAEQVSNADLYSKPQAVLCGTPQEMVAQMLNPESFYPETYELASSSGEAGVGDLGERFGELVGGYLKSSSPIVVTDYQGGDVSGRGGSVVNTEMAFSDEFDQSKEGGNMGVEEDATVTATLTLPNRVYGSFYALGSVLEEETRAFVSPSASSLGTGSSDGSSVCLPGESFYTCLGKKLGIEIGDTLAVNAGSAKASYEESNFSMTVMTQNINDFTYSYTLGPDWLSDIKEIYGENHPTYVDCYNEYFDRGSVCDEASVSETFSMWAEGTAYPLAEKSLYMQDYFMSIFDTEGMRINYISAPFVESYRVVGSVNVIGSGVYNGGNDVDGHLFEVASRAPATIQEQNIQLSNLLSTDTMSYSKIPGYTCEFAGSNTNGWITRDSDVSFSSEPVTIVGSNVGPDDNISDDLSIKVGRKKAITKEILLNSGYQITVDGVLVSLADAMKTTDIGIDKYKEVGPTVYSYGGYHYVAFNVAIGKEADGKTRYALMLAEITTSGNLVNLSAISDRVNHNRAVQMTSTLDGKLAVLFQSHDGKTCGSQDLSYCLHVAYYDVADGSVSRPVLVNNASYPAGYYSRVAVDRFSPSGNMVAVFQSWAGNSKTLHVASGDSIIQFPDVLASDDIAEEFSFVIDSYGQRHLVIMERGVMYHARWNSETNGVLNGYFVESVPLPLADRGARVKLGDIDIYYESSTGLGYPRLVIMYTVIPGDDSGSSAVVFLVEDSANDYWTVQPDGSNMGVAGSVYKAYVIDQNAIVDWTADGIKRPFLEGKTITSKNGRVDATLGFGLYGWTVYAKDVTGYSATSRVWERVYGDEFSFAYTTSGYGSTPLVVRAKDTSYYLGQEVTANLSSAYLPTSDSSTMSAGELMTLIDNSALAEGVKVVPNKLPGLMYVDNVWQTNPSKANCWINLKKYTPILPSTPTPYEGVSRYTCVKDPDTGNPIGCMASLDGIFSSRVSCEENCPVVSKPPVAGGYCTEEWCYTGAVHGAGVQKLSSSQIAKLTGVLVAQTGRTEQVAREQIVTLCGIAEEKNVSCPFMFAIWFQESSLRDEPSEISGKHLEFGCLLEGYYDSLEEQMLCAVDAAVENRGNEWDIALAEAISKEIAVCLVASNHTCQSTNCSRQCIEGYMDDVFSLEICGEYCCRATTKFGYIIEKYTPNDSTPSHGNSQGRENLRAMLRILIDEGIITTGEVSTSPEVCKQV